MISFEYDPGLIEQGVFLAVRSDPTAERELHSSTDAFYSIDDDTERNRAFANAHVAWFKRLKLDRLVGELIEERPLIVDLVERCVIREAARRKDEYAELFVRAGSGPRSRKDRTLVIQLCPESFSAPQRIVTHMQRELLHVSDMLDERFGYVPESFSGSPATQNLIRDRYRTIWATFVEGRLVREGRVSQSNVKRLERSFERLYGLSGDDASKRAFSAVFRADQLTHDRMMLWAREPERLLRSVGDSPSACAAVCGQGCSLGESSPKVILTKTKSHEAVGNRFS